jgi:mannose-6-phosphate isomerase-like protein (cupin superfamily)
VREEPVIRRNGDFRNEKIERMKGGEGYFSVTHLLNQDEFYGKGRLFARTRLEPGHSVGMHKHEGDMEACYFLSGSGTVYDEDGQHEVSAGDANIVMDGHSHSVVNTGNVPLEYIVLALYSK